MKKTFYLILRLCLFINCAQNRKEQKSLRHSIWKKNSQLIQKEKIWLREIL